MIPMFMVEVIMPVTTQQKFLLKAVRSEDAVIALRWVNVFALFWTDRKNG